MINNAGRRAFVDAFTQTSPSLTPLAVDQYIESSCQIEAIDLFNNTVPQLHTDARVETPISLQTAIEAPLVPQSNDSTSFRATLYASRQQPSISKVHNTRGARVISLPETVAEKDICSVASLFSECVSEACTNKGQIRAASMPQPLLSCDVRSFDGLSNVSSRELSNDSNDVASDDVCSGDSSVSTPRTVITRSFSSDLRRTPSPLSSSCDSVEFTLNRPVNSSDHFLVQSDTSSSSLESLKENKASAVIVDDWMTWSSSPPRPIPALHGPASLPYARCPSGAEGVIIEEQSSLPRMIWGLDNDRANYSPNYQRHHFTKPAYSHTVKPRPETIRQGYTPYGGNNAQFVQDPRLLKPNMQNSCNENEFSGARAASFTQDFQAVSEHPRQFALSPTAPEFHFTPKAPSCQKACDEYVTEDGMLFDNHPRSWNMDSGIYPVEDIAYLTAVPRLRQQNARLGFSDMGWLSINEPSLIELLPRDYESNNSDTRHSSHSNWTPMFLPGQYNSLKGSFSVNPEQRSHREMQMESSTSAEELLSQLHRLALSAAPSSRVINSNLDGLSLGSGMTSTASPSHPPGLPIPLNILATKNTSEKAHITKSYTTTTTDPALPYPRHNLANPRSIPLSRLRQKNAIKLPTVPEEGHPEGRRYDVKLPGSVKKPTHSSLLAPQPTDDRLQAQTMDDERSFIEGKLEKLRVKLPAVSVFQAESDSSMSLEEDSLKKKFLKKRRPSKIVEDHKATPKQTDTCRRRNVTV